MKVINMSNLQTTIVRKLFESKGLREAEFKAGGSTYKCVFGKYYKDGETITRDDYFDAKAKADGDTGASSAETPKEKKPASDDFFSDSKFTDADDFKARAEEAGSKMKSGKNGPYFYAGKNLEDFDATVSTMVGDFSYNYKGAKTVNTSDSQTVTYDPESGHAIVVKKDGAKSWVQYKKLTDRDKAILAKKSEPAKKDTTFSDFQNSDIEIKYDGKSLGTVKGKDFKGDTPKVEEPKKEEPKKSIEDPDVDFTLVNSNDYSEEFEGGYKDHTIKKISSKHGYGDEYKIAGLGGPIFRSLEDTKKVISKFLERKSKPADLSGLENKGVDVGIQTYNKIKKSLKDDELADYYNVKRGRMDTLEKGFNLAREHSAEDIKSKLDDAADRIKKAENFDAAKKIYKEEIVPYMYASGQCKSGVGGTFGEATYRVNPDSEYSWSKLSQQNPNKDVSKRKPIFYK